MMIFRLFATTVAIVVSSGILAEDFSKRYSATLTKCLSSAGAVDLVMKDCYYEELGLWDKRLNVAYNQMQKSSFLDQQSRQSLQGMQLAWIKYRDASCKFRFDSTGAGTAARVVEASCRLDFTIEKTLELEGWLLLRK